MTLAVAVRFPWPGLLDSLPTQAQRILAALPEAQPQPAILMSADSCWSYKPGEDFDNGGVKVGYIDTHATAIYAGNTAAGQKALGRLREEFVEAASHEVVDPERVLREVWQEHAHQGGGLHVCIGLIDAEGQARLLRFDHDDEFNRKQPVGVEPLGSPKGIKYFRQRLEEEVSWQVSRRAAEAAVLLSPEHWSTIIAKTVWDTCRKANDLTVGGPIHSAIITKGAGAQGRALWLIDPNEDEPHARGVSLTPTEVDAFYERQKERGWRGRSVART